jgi:hypothetical protein
MRIVGTRQRLEGLGVAHQRLGREVLDRLGRIANDNVFVAASRLTARTGMTIASVNDFIRDVLKPKTEAQQMGVIGEYEKRLENATAPSAKKKIPMAKRTRFLLIISNLEGLLDNVSDFTQLQFTDPAERATISKRVEELGKRLFILLPSAGSKAGKTRNRRAS